VDDIKNIAMQTLEGHLRAILGTMTVEEIYQNRDAFAQKVQEVAAGDMGNMGLGIVSFTIRDIRDTQGYLDALGKPRIAQVKRDAQIAQAEADRDAMIKSSQAQQAGQEAKFYLPDSQFIDNVQWHCLLPIDLTFNPAVPNQFCHYTDKELFRFTDVVKSVGGAITINVPLEVETGQIPQDSLAQLERLGRHLKTKGQH